MVESIKAKIDPSQMIRLGRLMQLSDSTLPVGAFSFSNGLESAIQTGVVTDKQSLEDYVELVVRQVARMDGVALLHALRAADSNDQALIVEIDHALWNRRVGHEQQMMLTRMGKKFAELVLRIGDFPQINTWLGNIKSGVTPGCFPVGQALAMKQLNAHEYEAFVAHQYGAASMILSAATRLMRIDHYDTQSILFKVQERVAEDYEAVRERSLDEMSTFAPVFDVLVAHHAKAHVRLFMN